VSRRAHNGRTDRSKLPPTLQTPRESKIEGNKRIIHPATGRTTWLKKS